MSPVDSAIASGATSGMTTKAPSVVAEGDLEKFEDEEQFPPPPSAGGYGYQGYPDQMHRGKWWWWVQGSSVLWSSQVA